MLSNQIKTKLFFGFENKSIYFCNASSYKLWGERQFKSLFKMKQLTSLATAVQNASISSAAFMVACCCFICCSCCI